MPSLAYPTTLSSECLQLIIEVVGERQFSPRMPEFAQAIWEVQGFVQSQLLPISAEKSLSIRGQHLNDEQACAILGQLSRQIEAGPDARSLMDHIPWDQIIQWLLAKMLEALLHHYSV